MVAIFLLIWIATICNCQEIFIEEQEIGVATCIQRIIKQWHRKASVVSYVNLSPHDNEINKAIHSMNFVSLITRTSQHMDIPNEAYLIIVNDLDIFTKEFGKLSKEGGWKPNVYFLIVFIDINEISLKDVFNILLRYHVYEVLVLNGTSEAEIYSYNPFDNYGCGKYFSEIQSHGRCSVANMSALYAPKFSTELQKCTLNAAVSHWPPYAINPKYDNNSVKLMGTERYVLDILSKLGDFKINYTFMDDGEEFSTIDKDMTVVGPLSRIQKENVDMIFGGMLLTSRRSEAFSYFCIHEANSDELSIMVEKAGPVSPLKNVYLEFSLDVWILLGFTFWIFFGIIVLVFRVKDKCAIILIMWDQLFLHSWKLKVNMKMKILMFQWAIFAFLMNICYQSNLMGLTTHTSTAYQISTERDLVKYNIQPCISLGIRKIIKVVKGNELNHTVNSDCHSLFKSIDTVRRDPSKYTIALYSVFNHNKQQFNDEFGQTGLYSFKKPFSKVIYAVYLYKGFPMVEKFYLQAMHIREGGIVDKNMRDLFYEKSRKYFYAKKKFQARFIFPWPILVFGYSLATIVLIGEVLIHLFKHYQPILL